MLSKKLEVTSHKSEAILFTLHKEIPLINITMNRQNIPIFKQAKYLGVTFFTRLTIRPHVKAVSTSAKTLIASLIRIMPNINGPSENKRKLIMSISNSKLLYGAPT